MASALLSLRFPNVFRLTIPPLVGPATLRTHGASNDDCEATRARRDLLIEIRDISPGAFETEEAQRLTTQCLWRLL